MKHTILFTTALILTAACGNMSGQRGTFTGQGDVNGGTVMLEPTGAAAGVNSVQCAVTTSASLLDHQQTVSVTVNASGGTAPYSFPGYGTFSSQKVVSGFYNNLTATNRVVERTFQISDAVGNYGTCSFVVTVKPSSNSGSGPVTGVGAGCTISADTGTPKLNTPFKITVTPNGATTYKLKSLYLQNGWYEQVNQSYSTPVNFDVTYRTKGARTATAIVEHSGQSYSCSLSLQVLQPALKLTASPAVGAPIGGTIGVSAEASDFAASPAITYSFTANDALINLAPNGNSVVVTANDSNSHSFDLTVTASQSLVGGGILAASEKIRLNFAPAVPVACSMRLPQTLLPMSGQVSIPVLVDGTNGAVTIASVTSSPDGVISSGLNSPVVVSFATSGMKTISIVGARSAATGVLCNGTGIITQTVSVVGPMSACSASTNANPSLSGAAVRAKVTLPVGAGYGPYELTVSNSSQYFQALERVGQMEQIIRFRRPGTYQLSFVVRDTFTNQVATCTSEHIVYEADVFVAGQDSPGNKVRVFKGPYPAEILSNGGFMPFSDVLPNFTGGIRVATGDLNADGRADIVTAAGYGGGLRVRSWNGITLAKIHDLVAFVNKGITTTRTYLASGDINADGHADIVVGTGCDAQMPLVEVFNGKTGNLLVSFRSADTSGGNRVAVGDVDGDGYSDVVVSSCLSSTFRVFSGKALSSLNTGWPAVVAKEIVAYPGVNTNMKIAVGDVDGDGFADIISGTNGTSARYIKVFDGRPTTGTAAKALFTPFSTAGINYLGTGDLNSDGVAEILVGGDGTNGQLAELKVFAAQGAAVHAFGGYSDGKLKPFGNWTAGRLYVAGGSGGL